MMPTGDLDKRKVKRHEAHLELSNKRYVCIVENYEARLELIQSAHQTHWVGQAVQGMQDGERTSENAAVSIQRVNREDTAITFFLELNAR